jgi:NADH-quinone oxidoreductase subunit J
MFIMFDYLIQYFLIALCVLIFLSLILISLQTSPIYAVFSFILTAFLTFWLLIFIQAEFFALLILIIYIGVITVLFLFIVFMYNLRVLTTTSIFFLTHPVFIFINIKVYWLVQICLQCLYPCLNQNLLLLTDSFQTLDIFYFVSLFNDHFISFLVTGLLIFLALIGCIVITFPFYKTGDVN